MPTSLANERFNGQDKIKIGRRVKIENKIGGLCEVKPRWKMRKVVNLESETLHV